MISTTLDILNVVRNRVSALGNITKVISNLFNLAFGGISISFGKSLPSIMGNRALQNERDKWVGKGASKSSKNEFVLAKPSGIGRIRRGGSIFSNGFRRSGMRTVDEFIEVIAKKGGFKLSFPGDRLGRSEFEDLRKGDDDDERLGRIIIVRDK